MSTAFGDKCERLFLGDLFSLLRPVSLLGTKDWAERHRVLTSEVSAFQGTYSAWRTPHMLQVMASMDDPSVKVIVARKSAQIGWSETQNNYLGRIIHSDPQNIIMAFPRRDSGKDYSDEKLRVLFRTTPELLELVGDPDKAAWNRFKFPGGFLKLITAASVSAMKSTSAPIIIVEEPDDLSSDIKSQGDALAILMERQKTFEESKLIYGGTPTDAGFSNVEKAYASSNKMKLLVACHACETRHELSFANLKREPFESGLEDPVFGKYDPKSAHYLCPSCGTEWSLAQKNENIRQTCAEFPNFGWEITKPDVTSAHGFSFNELMSPFPASSYEKLAEKLCKAEVALAQGNEGPMKSFVNNQKGRAYTKKLDNIDYDALRQRTLDYPELIVPVGGLVLTMGVDVQHDRLACIIRAWGRKGNSWLVWWGEIYGATDTAAAPVWKELEETIFASYPYASQKEGQSLRLPISAVSIDSSDRTEVVYTVVKRLSKRMKTIFATKGDSDTGATNKPIFNVPSDPDAGTPKAGRKKLWETMGVNLYIVGTQSAKDEVLRRAALEHGNVDRFYVYKEVRNDYFDQLLSNVKQLRGSRTRYVLPPGKRDEVLDCECLALHATYAIGMHNWDAKVWDGLEQSLSRNSALEKYLGKKRSPRVTPGLGIENDLQ